MDARRSEHYGTTLGLELVKGGDVMNARSNEGDARRKVYHPPLRQGYQPVKGKQSSGQLGSFATSCVAMIFLPLCSEKDWNGLELTIPSVHRGNLLRVSLSLPLIRSPPAEKAQDS